MACDLDDSLRFDCVGKDPDEIKPVILNLWNLVAVFWESNEEYAAGEYVWPSKPMGYCAQCTIAGRSGASEPRWLPTPDVALTKRDGSVEWTMRPPGPNGLSLLGANPVAEAPPGIIVAALVVSEGHKLLVDYESGVDGEEYEVKFNFTIAGRARVGRQLVQVRRK